LAHRGAPDTLTDVKRPQQTFENEADRPIYVCIEPWPECFELEPGDKLTLVYEPLDTGGDAPTIQIGRAEEIAVWPNAKDDDIE
jgi:hypothetical protein